MHTAITDCSVSFSALKSEMRALRVLRADMAQPFYMANSMIGRTDACVDSTLHHNVGHLP